MDKILIHRHNTHLFTLPNKRTKTNRVEAKVVMTILNFFGIPIFGLGIYLNIGTLKADILWGIGVLYGVTHIVFKIIERYQDIKKRGKDLNK